MSQHVVALLDGTVAQAGAPQELYDQPASPSMASFLGASRVRGVVDEQGGEAFVKPQDVRMTRAPSNTDKDAPLAQVERVKVVGPRVKVELRLRSNGDRMQVEVGREEFEALGVNTGDLVVVDVKNARVFLGDFAI